MNPQDIFLHYYIFESGSADIILVNSEIIIVD
jgi:hypothetical protein